MRADGWTDTKLIPNFHNLGNAPKMAAESSVVE